MEVIINLIVFGKSNVLQIVYPLAFSGSLHFFSFIEIVLMEQNSQRQSVQVQEMKYCKQS